MIRIGIALLVGIMHFDVAAAGGIDPDKRIADVIILLKANKPVEAFEEAFKGNTLSQSKRTEMNLLKQQFADFVSQVGVPYECEPMANRSLLDRYRIDQFLCLSETRPFVIQFDFYRPLNDWKVQTFSFYSDVGSRIEEDIAYEVAESTRHRP